MHLENIIVSEVSQREKEKFTISLVSLYPWKESYEKPGQCIKKQRHHFANIGLSKVKNNLNKFRGNQFPAAARENHRIVSTGI